MYKEKIVNAITGDETLSDYTAAQIAEAEAGQALAEAQKAEAEAKATLRGSALAKLAALGLTADEIASL
jgi:DNA-binding NarL/FixJ family response regulator